MAERSVSRAYSRQEVVVLAKKFIIQQQNMQQSMQQSMQQNIQQQQQQHILLEQDLVQGAAAITHNASSGSGCTACNGYYGPNFSQPFCATCHAFLFDSEVQMEEDVQDLEIILKRMSWSAASHGQSRNRRSRRHHQQDGAAALPPNHPGDGGDDNDSSDDRDSGNEEEPTDNEQDLDAAAAADNENNNNAEQDAALNIDEPAADAIHDAEQEDEGEGDLEAVADQEEEEDEEPEVIVQPPPAVAGAHAIEPPPEVDQGGIQVENVAAILAQILASSNMEHPGGGASIANLAPYELCNPNRKQGDSSRSPNSNSYPPVVGPESLEDRLSLLTVPRPGSDPFSRSGMVDSLPPEVLLFIFKFLDDISLYAVGNVCKRWHALQREMGRYQWQANTHRRWPLFRPVGRVVDWFSTYSALMESSFCLACINQMAESRVPPAMGSAHLREKRLSHDLKGLVVDPPEGIRAQPLDPSVYHWQASIAGPVGSPYEGGIFFLYLRVPLSYPFKPPKVRFLTKIFHPNVSPHGDIGIDILQHNWVVGLTIPKVLLSIQSLLTDPYPAVCMWPDIGRLYTEDKKMFEAVAREAYIPFSKQSSDPGLVDKTFKLLGIGRGSLRCTMLFLQRINTISEYYNYRMSEKCVNSATLC